MYKSIEEEVCCLLRMTLTEASEYRGKDPCPQGFEAYWEKALAEMHGLKQEISMIPSTYTAPSIECFDLFFNGVRGARIHAKYLRPKKWEKPCPAVVKFHGYGHFSEDWTRLLPYALSGFCVAAIDCRGQGGLSNDPGGTIGRTFGGQLLRGIKEDPQNLVMRHIMLDAAELVEIIMSFDEVDETRVGTFGNSQGGGLCLAAAALTGANRTAAEFPFLGDYRMAYSLNGAAGAYEELKEYFRFFDPLHEKEDDIFQKLGFIDVKNIVRMTKAKTVVFTGLTDVSVPAETQFAIYNNIPAEKTQYVFPDFGHEDIPMVDDITYQFMSEMI